MFCYLMFLKNLYCYWYYIIFSLFTKKYQDGIEQTLSEMKEDSIHMEEFLQETKAQYESLKEQCDNLETVFGEYGYRYDENNVLEE